MITAARKMGYFSDQSGIIKRYINEEGGWNKHLNLCKKYIIDCAQNKKKGKCAILGSGWLLDVPLNYLTDTFQEVYLVDIIHPKQVILKIRKYKNAHIITEDLSGGAIQMVYSNRRNLKQRKTEWLNNLKLNNDFFYHDFDFVISLNILNQLDVLLIDYIKSKLKSENDLFTNLRKIIQSNHINSLPKLKSCLIADITEIQVDIENNVIQSENLIFTDLKNIKNKKEWEWDFDSQYTYHKDFKTINKVMAGEI